MTVAAIIAVAEAAGSLYGVVSKLVEQVEETASKTDLVQLREHLDALEVLRRRAGNQLDAAIARQLER